MPIKNVEFKAKVASISPYEEKLLALNPIYKGTDHQIDTYFNATKGRLKLREGNIENALIQYERANTASAKLSDILLYQHRPDPALKAILTEQLGVKVVVDKQRKIYFIDNVKFHFDEVQALGTFLEVEAIDREGNYSVETLEKQCQYYFDFLSLDEAQLMKLSYSDLILKSI